MATRPVKIKLSTHARSFACIISPDPRESLTGIAHQFAHTIEGIEDGILFDVSGLERLMGKPQHVAKKILQEMRRQNIVGSVAVAETVDTAKLLARSECASPRVSKGGTSNVSISPSLTVGLVQPDMFSQLPLADLAIEEDTLNVFSDLGLQRVEDLLAVPADDLVGRYGQQFRDVIDTIEQKGVSLLVPNVKENRVSWSFELDNPVEDFEQLIFVLNHGLERLFDQVAHCGFSTEHLDLQFKLRNKTDKSYEIKTSFPTLERAFWLKLINLRASLDPPEASITCVDVTAHFTKARPSQRGLYAVSRPDPEDLLLTVGKLKKLVGEENVGIWGGANIIRQYLKAGLLDEMQIHLIPILLGGGVRLFEDLDPEGIELRRTSSIDSPGATHFRFEVVKRRT